MTTSLALTVALAVSPAVPVQRPAAPAAPLALQMERAAAAEAHALAAPNLRRPGVLRRDPVGDGGITGAIAGAIAGGAFWYGVCRVMDETYNRSGDCWEPELGLSAAIGAGVGALLGIGVDALLDSRPRLR